MWVIELWLHDLHAAPFQVEPGAEISGSVGERGEEPLASAPLALLLRSASVNEAEEGLLRVGMLAGSQSSEVFNAAAWW